MMNEPLSTIMATDLVTVSPDDTLQTVRRLFLKNRVHHLPVIDDNNKLAGLISTYDFFKLNLNIENIGSVKVHEIMTTHLATLEPDEKVGAAAEVFLEHLFHAVPIAKDGKLVGIVTSFDILKYQFHKEYPQHAL